MEKEVQEREFMMEDGTVVKRKLTDTELALERLQKKRAREADGDKGDKGATGEECAPPTKRRREDFSAHSKHISFMHCCMQLAS